MRIDKECGERKGGGSTAHGSLHAAGRLSANTETPLAGLPPREHGCHFAAISVVSGARAGRCRIDCTAVELLQKRARMSDEACVVRSTDCRN